VSSHEGNEIKTKLDRWRERQRFGIKQGCTKSLAEAAFHHQNLLVIAELGNLKWKEKLQAW
jgi:hypothetical protein